MTNTKPNIRTLLSISLGLLLGTLAFFPSISSAQEYAHFGSICRSAPDDKKDVVSIELHKNLLAAEEESGVTEPLQDVTVNVLWSYVDYRQNHAVFKYKQASCVTDNNGACKFNGGSGRARWQLVGIDGYDVDTAFDATANCPDGLVPANSFMIDFW